MSLLFQAIIMGIVQGLTEFLPISSSAHLIIVPRVLGWDDTFVNSAGFDVMMHMGTLVALLLYFWRDLLRLLGAWLASIRDRRIANDPDRRLAWLLFISMLPGAVLGAALENFFDAFLHDPSRLIFVAALIAVGAVLLWIAERWSRHTRKLQDMEVSDAVVIGAAQAGALFAGISRSGITIAAGLFMGLEREAAARFSFLMAVPIIAGAGLWKGRELISNGIPGGDLGPLLAGMVAALISGLIAVAVLLAYLRRHSTNIFIWYRLILAAFLVVYVLTR